MNEIIFEVTQEADGAYGAECLTEPIFAQADSWDELRAQVRDAVTAHFFDQAGGTDRYTSPAATSSWRLTTLPISE